MSYSKRVIWVAAVMAAAGSGTVRAVDFTWSNGSADFTWANAGNWNPGGGPPNNSFDRALFSNTGAGTIDLAAVTYTVSELNFSNTAGNDYVVNSTTGGFFLNDGSLAANIIHTGSGNVRINAPINVGFATTVTGTVSGGGRLTLGNTSAANISSFSAGSAFTVSNNSTLEIKMAGGTGLAAGSVGLNAGTVQLQGGTLLLSGELVAGGLSARYVGINNNRGATNLGFTAAGNYQFSNINLASAKTFIGTTPLTYTRGADNTVLAGVAGYDGGAGVGVAYAGFGYNNGNYGAGAPFAADGFATTEGITARFGGKINITNGGNYRFSTRSDDGSLLFINGQLVVNNNASQGGTTRFGDINLAAGQHDILVVYYEGTGGAGLDVVYRGLDALSDTTGATGTPAGFSAGDVYIPANVLSAYQTSVNMTSTNVAVSVADSAVTVENADQVNLGGLTMESGRTLTSTGIGAIRFAGSTLQAGSAYGFNVASGNSLFLGTVSNLSGGAATVTKTGAGNLILDSTTVPSGMANLTFSIQDGRLIAVTTSTAGNPLGDAANGASVTIDSATAAFMVYTRGASANFDNRVTFNASGSVEVGADGTGGLTIGLGSATRATTAANGVNARFAVDSALTLNLVGAFTAPGGGATTANVVKDLNGDLTFSAVSNYTGTTTINGGIINVNATGAINTTSGIFVTGTNQNTFGIRLGAASALSPLLQRQIQLAANSVVVSNAANSLSASWQNKINSNIRFQASNATGINQNLEINPGGIFEVNVGSLTGTGTIQLAPGSLIRMTNGTSLTGAQFTQAIASSPYRTLQINGTISTVLSGLNAGSILEVFGNNRNITGVDFQTLSGVFLTNDGTSRNVDDNAAANRRIGIGNGGLNISASGTTTLAMLESITTNGNALTIGTFRPLHNLLKNGGGFVRFSNAANDFTGTTNVDVTAGSVLIANATTTGAGGFNAGLNPRIFNGIVRVDGGTAGAVENTATIGDVTVAGFSALSVGRAGTAAQSSSTLFLDGPITRTNNGILRLITSNSAINGLAGAATGAERISFVNPADAPVNTINGANGVMIDPWIIEVGNANRANFARYDTVNNQFAVATYTGTTNSFADAAADRVKQITAATANAANITLAALRTTEAITGAGTINLVTGGLIIDSGTNRTIANNINFGNAEGMVFTHGGIHTMSGVISGTNGFTKTGTTLVINNAGNTFTGSVTINQGSLVYTADGALGNAANNIVLNGGNLRPNFNTTLARNVTVNAGGGGINPEGNARTLLITGQITGAGELTYSVVTGGATSAVITVDPTAGSNTYSGGTRITGGATGTGGTTVVVDQDNDLGAASGHLVMQAATGNVTLRAAGSFAMDRDVFLFNSGSLVPRIEVDGGMTLTLNNVVDGSGGLTKQGAGTLILNSAIGNAYLGNTTVNAGVLVVGNTSFTGTGAGTVTVNNGGTLGGNGRILGATTIATGGTLDPSVGGVGGTTGNLTFEGGLDLAFDSQVIWDLAANSTANPGTDWDRITIDQGNNPFLNVAAGANLLINFAGATIPDGVDAFWLTTQRWNNVFDFVDPVLGTVNGTTFDIDNSFWASFGAFTTEAAVSGRGIDIVWTPIPEPTTVALFAAAGVAGIVMLRRRNRAKA